MTRAVLVLLAVLVAIPLPAARAADDDGPWKSSTFSGLKFRGIGPATPSGRIGDLAIDPTHNATWYVAVASGGVWKTKNAGTTFEPIFDDQGSYSIGCITLDPNDPMTVWVGTGENNSQRSVSYGDGVYKSTDGGKTWKHMGLKESEHVGMITVDPRDSDVVYVAAQGPLWRSGDDRGLYKTTDGGTTWNKILDISPDTGVSEIFMKPGEPDVLFAVAYQRRRHVWTLINGGPESALYKSTDAGATWDKLKGGLPTGEVGRIGMTISPVDPNVVYAVIEATGDDQGFYRSTDGGANWKKQSDHVSGSPQYYQELFADPKDVDRVYSMSTFMQVTEDGGKTFSRVPARYKHVDDHALWIDPKDTDHLIVGCDGGIYETWDRGEYWDYKANLPVVQFYRISVDQDTPFYNVYGGTQDNNSLGGPSRTISSSGITNADWFVTLGGDGYETQVDPINPDILYSQYQYGGLVRYDRKSGEAVDIQPQAALGDAPLKWNWDSPLLLSPHRHTRLYYGANRLFRTDDRGNSWTPVSPDLTRKLDRNRLEVMGRVWGVDTVAKNRSTSFFGNIVSLDESPRVEGLLYVGTDDGLIQVSSDGGEQWTRIERFRGVPEMTYVSDVAASLHEDDVVYATFDNHKNGDFAPYVLRSNDRGRSWRSIAGNLPERGTVYTFVQDHEDPDLLFVGTEFGVFFSVDAGRVWTQLDAGIPVIVVRDLDIQRRENDLIVGTFGRGIYILDDYTPLRNLSAERLAEEGVLFPTRRTWLFAESYPYGGRENAFQGDSFFSAPNPPLGAVLTYRLNAGLKTLEEQRQEREKEALKAGEDVFYPDWDALRAEEREAKPAIVLTVRDSRGEIVRRLTGPVSKGFHRVTWDLRYPAPQPTSLTPFVRRFPWSSSPQGPLVAPGLYEVTMEKSVRGELVQLSEPHTFEVVALGNTTLPARDRQDLVAFQQDVAGVYRAALGASRLAAEVQSRLDHAAQAIHDTPDAPVEWLDDVRSMDARLKDLLIELEGDRTIRRRSEPTVPSILNRIQRIVWGAWESTSEPTRTHRDNLTIARRQFGPVLDALRRLAEVDVPRLEDRLEDAGAPWTPGRVPRLSN